MALGVFVRDSFAILLKIAQMGVTRAQLLAEKSVNQNALRAFLSYHATRIVAYVRVLPALLTHSPCVRMAKTWLTLSAMASVTLPSQKWRTPIGGLAPTAPRDVSFRLIGVTESPIVTMPLN